MTDRVAQLEVLISELANARWRSVQLKAAQDMRDFFVAQLQAAEQKGRREALEIALAACERIADEYEEREGRKYPELKSDAETGASDCESAIRALIDGGAK